MNNPPDPVTSTVKRGTLDGKKVADALAVINTTCNAGSACPEVQADPIASAALNELKVKLGDATTCVTTKKKIDQDRKTAGQNVSNSFKEVKISLGMYETAVVVVAGGDASVINKAGLEARPEAPAATPPVQQVPKVTSTLGKAAQQAVLRWPQPPGADHYEVEVNFTPQNPTGPYTSLGTCSRRHKLVTAPAAGAQFLARICAIASDGTRAPWSASILATAR